MRGKAQAAVEHKPAKRKLEKWEIDQRNKQKAAIKKNYERFYKWPVSAE